MSTTNPWLNPLQRSYNQIKSKIVEGLKLKVPEITDFSEGNIFMILTSIFSAIAEVLHYYIDAVSAESFFVTARKYSSLKKHAKMVDYHIRSANPSMADILISLTSGVPIKYNTEIPAGMIFYSQDGTPYISDKPVIWYAGSYGVNVPVSQKQYRADVNFGTNSSQDIQIYLGDLGTGQLYAEGSMELNLTSGNTTNQWTLVDTFAYSNPNSKHFMVELDEDYLPYIKFGNGVYGAKPPLNSTIRGSFYTTYGESGNSPEGFINSTPTELSSIITDPLTCINPEESTGGSDYEDFDMVKEHLPLSIKTLGVAITQDDYEAIARLAPGVDKAYVNYKCGKFVDIYITPDGGGIAPSGLLESTLKFILKRKVITTSITIYSARVSSIVLRASITGKKSFRANDISTQVINDLFYAYSYATSDINKVIRLSDIYARLKALSMVDYLKIDNLYLTPLFIKVGQTSKELNASVTIEDVTTESKYIIRYSSSDSKFHLLTKSYQPTGITIPLNVTTHITHLGNSWFITIRQNQTQVYTNGDLWSVNINQNNVDQEPTDFTIPVFNDVNQVVLSITETV